MNGNNLPGGFPPQFPAIAGIYAGAPLQQPHQPQQWPTPNNEPKLKDAPIPRFKTFPKDTDHCENSKHRSPVEAFDAIVNVHVGTDDKKETFQAYSGLLRHYSGYFARALGGSFIEAETGEVHLPGEDPTTFRLFFRFLNSGRLYETQTLADAYLKPLDPTGTLAFCTESQSSAGAEVVAAHMTTAQHASVYDFDFNKTNGPALVKLIQLYTFADAHDIPLLEDIAITAILDHICLNGLIPLDHLEKLGESSLRRSALYKMLTELVATFVDDGDFRLWERSISKQLCFDIMCAQHTVAKERFDAAQKKLHGVTFTACKWHLHS